MFAIDISYILFLLNNRSSGCVAVVVDDDVVCGFVFLYSFLFKYNVKFGFKFMHPLILSLIYSLDLSYHWTNFE